MINSIKGLVIFIFLAMAQPITANAMLIDRGNGLLYDSYFDITWLSDAYYPMTSGYLDNTSTTYDNGRLTWSEALTWADQLEYAGFSNWRLPTMQDLGDSGCDYSNGSTDCGYNSDTNTSEMAHLYYDDLNNIASYDINGNPQTGYGSINSGLFSNIQSCFYWTDQQLATDPSQAWFFNFCDGSQDTHSSNYSFFVMAVHEGDVSVSDVPVPGVAGLFVLTVFAGLFAGVKRRK